MIENKENLGAKQKIADNGQDISALSSQSAFPKLSTKNELVVWVSIQNNITPKVSRIAICF